MSRKVGEGHLAAMGRMGLPELRNAVGHTNSNVQDDIRQNQKQDSPDLGAGQEAGQGPAIDPDLDLGIE